MRIRARITFDAGIETIQIPNDEIYTFLRGALEQFGKRFLDERVEMERNEEAPVPISRFSPRRDFIIGSRSPLSTGNVADSMERSAKGARFLSYFGRVTTYKCLTSFFACRRWLRRASFAALCRLAKGHLLLRCILSKTQ